MKVENEESFAHSHKIQVNPGHVNQLIEVPLVMGRNGAAVRERGHDIKFLMQFFYSIFKISSCFQKERKKGKPGWKFGRFC